MHDTTDTQTAFRGARRAADYTERTTPPPSVEPTAAVDPGPVAIVEVDPAPAIEPVEVESFEDLGRDLSTAHTIGPAPHATMGIRGALRKLGIRLAPGAAETAALDAAAQLRRDEETIRQSTWTRAVSILVANPKGGTGKTPTSILLGGTLAATRGGSVAIMEVADDRGTLTFRAEGSPRRGIGELVRDAEQIRSAGQLAGYTAPQTSFASVIGTVGPRPQLSGDDIRQVARVIDEYFAIRVMDSGNQPSSSAFDGAVDTADVLVIPVLNSADVVLEALAMLEHMRARGGKAKALADQAIVIRLTDGRVEHPQLVERLTRLIDGAGIRAVHHVPYDAHIAERGQLTLDKLDPSTRAAFTAAAAGIVHTINDLDTTQQGAAA